ncbi:hypothetical protein A3H10_03745 [Candidatus Uhrbacteria bacterium RIFCSPLOWO2_12_FULL_46_10]|uniref:Uncharacterized protein n=1 Tax=Candidatus Uhrbacteria bacterium RIFCSPLOWO2_01_FULL_47_25 TaxID=1802402 RepID=A0A1F7UU01_9BACT|nr:MAG: hypothetical protein A2752_04725 [Candidatus Uhrbacteria bacterium RIFCSPHIGHO2_01_FULL_46_23]OGL69352.1 MAG: hypothetical protein A3D60_05490 [Candidatus Uhrbacteria bacterium RIFCSPHIGHO2_02_FULL_47_29]OGL74987.1 MAG: hypothetical protein A3E96_02570 [Candidatus Uhrbacteria bacterium RIFCSPHIGHO2_12_FULL_46_13]OGL81736.1 MAG: hypothetical protein A2936_04940 [Candidatus Uhrbacteria bacterium RIFCSPLOWO2_01_FULL_47_25]OGL85834.1 MAG: hypothetical protein A3I37_02945 [Candidatus Uhrbact
MRVGGGNYPPDRTGFGRSGGELLVYTEEVASQWRGIVHQMVRGEKGSEVSAQGLNPRLISLGLRSASRGRIL